MYSSYLILVDDAGRSYHRNLSLKKTLKDYVIIKEKLNCVLVFIIFDLG